MIQGHEGPFPVKPGDELISDRISRQRAERIAEGVKRYKDMINRARARIYLLSPPAHQLTL